MSSNTPNIYTNAPDLNPNFILGGFQILFWLIFHPSAWRNYISSFDPDLPPDFSLSDLKKVHWHSSFVFTLLLRSYLICPLLIGLLTASSMLGLLWVLGKNVSVQNFVTHLASVTAYSVIVTVTTSVTSSLASATVYGSVIGLTLGVVNGMTNEVAISIAYGLPAGLAGAIAISFSKQQSLYLARQLGGIITGILSGGLMLITASFVINSVPDLTTVNITQFDYMEIILSSIGIGILFGLGFSLVIGLNIGRWRQVLMYGLVFGIGFGATYYLIISVKNTLIVGMAKGVLGGIVCGGFWSISYISAKRIAGAQGGAIIGALIGGIIWITLPFLFQRPIPLLPTLPFSLTIVLLGLTVYWWRPILMYPLLKAFNSLLYYTDLRRADSQPSLLHWHSAFWNENHYLRLSGLANHLLLIAERNPIEAQAAIEYLIKGRHREAAQSVQIELIMRSLQSCTDIWSLSKVHHYIISGELGGLANTSFKMFSRYSQDIEAALNQVTTYHRRLILKAVETDLYKFGNELTLSNEPYTLRCHPIVLHWHQIVSNYISELAKTVELAEEIANPYIFGIPLSEQQEIFIGRVDIVTRIEQLLLAKFHSPLLLYGQRRMGKTSLLLNLSRLLPYSIIPFFIDGQMISMAVDYPDLLYTMANIITSRAESLRHLTLPSVSHSSLTASPFTRFIEWVNEVEQILHKNQAVGLLILDEFEALETVSKKGHFDINDLLALLRHLIQHHPRLKLILSGSHSLGEFQHWASYLINVQVVKISYLTEYETRLLIEEPVRNFALRYEQKAAQRVVEITRGHPTLVQLLCYEIITLKNEQSQANRKLVSLIDIETAALKTLEHGAFLYFADIQRNQIDTNGLNLLHFMAKQGEGAVVDWDALTRQIKHPSKLDQTLELLLRRDLIEQVDGGYRFQVELTRRWFVSIGKPSQIKS